MLPRRLVVITTLLGLLMVLLVGVTLFRYDTENVRLTFEQEVTAKLAKFERELHLHTESVHVLKSFFASSDHVSSAEFALFSKHFTSRNPAIMALEWAPMITHEQRMQMNFGDYNYAPNLQITERQSQGVMKNAAPRAYYFPVVYVEPRHTNESALGFDLASQENRKLALLAAINSGQAVASEPLQLVQANHFNTSILLFEPVYKNKLQKYGDLESIEGVVVGVYSLEKLFESVIRENMQSSISFRLVDTSEHQQIVIYQSGDAALTNPSSLSSDFLLVKDLPSFHGRNWRVYALPSNDYISSQRSVLPYVITVSAILLFALIGYYTNALTLANYRLHLSSTRLKELNRFDTLTGIYNRGYFDRLIEVEWQRAKRSKSTLSLLMIDIDFFKNYNDHYGHVAGDKCLVTVAHTLNVTLKRSTDSVARYGGEEFVVVLPATKDPLATAEKIRKAVLALALEHKRSQVCDYVTISVGVATLNAAESSNYTQLIMNADEALYQAKREGRNRVRIFNNNQSSKVVELKT